MGSARLRTGKISALALAVGWYAVPGAAGAAVAAQSGSGPATSTATTQPSTQAQTAAPPPAIPETQDQKDVAGSGPPPTPADPAAEAPQTGIADIVVFGQRKTAGESAQRVPIAITAVDSRMLTATNSVSLADIGSLAPNVQTTPVGTTPGFPNFSIRGVGISSSIRSIDPAVNIIQDGMVLAYQAGAVASTFDLDSLEILRGPQGVLFGRNATGGAISLRTRKPLNHFQLLGDASYGNFNTLDLSTSVEGPLAGNTLLGKVAVLYHRSDGFITNTNKGVFLPAPGNPTAAPSNHGTGQVQGLDELTIKPTFTVNVADGHTLNLFAQYERYNDDGTAPRNFVPASGPTVPLQTTYGFYPAAGKYETNILTAGYVRLREHHVIAELVDRVGPGQLTTVAGYRHLTYDSTINLSGGPFVLFYWPDNRELNREFSVETRYNVAVTDNLDLTAGLFYLDSYSHVIEQRVQTGPATAPNTRIYQRAEWTQGNAAEAAFANVDWKVSDQLKLSAGGRYSTERKRITIAPLTNCVGQGFSTCPQTFGTSSHRWNDFSPRVVLTYTPVERVLLFASFTKGFRSGNYNARATTFAGIGPADPEKVQSYELGAKTDLFSRKLRFNLSIYQEDYSDIQQVLTGNVPGAGVIQTLLNAADARIRGAEAEVNFQPVAALRLDGAFGYTDAQFASFDVAVAGVADPTQLKFAKVPKYTASGSATYTMDLPSLDAKLAARVAYDWRSRVFTEFLNTPALAQNAYGLLNANLTLTKGDWSLSVYGRNLMNVEYADTKGRNVAYVAWGGQPRTYGLRGTFKFR